MKSFYKLFLAIGLVFNCFTFEAADVYWSGRVEGTAISTGELFVEDGDYANIGSGSFQDVNSYGYVRLGISDKFNGAYTMSLSTISVEVKITPYDDYGTALTPITETLVVEYSSDGNDDILLDAMDYRMQGVHKFTVKVMSVTGTLKDYVYLDAGFWAERYYLFSSMYVPSIAAQMIMYNADGSMDLTCTSTTVTCQTTDEIYLQWDYVQGAESYDLEWAWVDNYSDAGLASTLSTGSISLTDLEFKNNSTRIRTTDQFYRIPQVFGKGYLIYRVRGVGRWLDAPTKDLYGKWSSENGQAKTWVSNWPHIVTIAYEHEGSKNWQYQATYAEQGKKKEVTQYFDGSLRGRQTVTRINSQDQSVVGETIYDNEGRGVIQILPVPQDNPAIKYYPGLTKEQTNTRPYSHKQFDWEELHADCQTTSAEAIGTATGAGEYYSAAGHATDTDWQQYVPEANGYAFTQVEYTPDNTGRIRNQSGVGPTHKIGSGHETFYYYLQPSQEELNRLFGYKVGYKSRYKKNMVVDANGQVSISYLDAQGRVIATALAGDNNTEFVSLDSETAGNHLQMTTDLLNKENIADPDTELDDNELSSTGRFGALNDALEMSTQLGVVENGTQYVLDYKILSDVYEESCGETDGVAYRYVYDLTLSLMDDCGVERFDTTFTQVGTEQIGALIGANRQWQETVNLNKGSYTLQKTLKVNEQALLNYKAHYLSDANECLIPSEDFAASISTDCGTTCEECAEGLGTESEFLAQAQELEGSSLTQAQITLYTNQYNTLLAECLEPCAPLTSCDAYEGMLLGDLHPLGQYGSENPADELSVFNQYNSLGGYYSSVGIEYFDQFGNAALVEAYEIGTTGTYSLTDPTTDGSGVMELIAPDLLSRVDFIASFQESWAKSLLPFHPEYALYEYATDICTTPWDVPTSSGTVSMSSDEFDGMVQNITEFASVASNAYNINLSPTGSAGSYPIYDEDPYFHTTYAKHTYSIVPPTAFDLTVLKTNLMLEALANYPTPSSSTTMLQFAAKTVLCGNDYAGTCTYPSTWAQISSLPVAQKDAIWSMYRSYYQSQKSKINQYLMDLYGFDQAPGLYNGCIGTGGLSMGVLPAFSQSSYYNTMGQHILNLWTAGGGIGYTTLPTALCGTLYDSKQMRIVRVDGLYNPALPVEVMIAQGSATAQYGQWEQTGLCPLTMDVERLLHTLGSTDRLNLVTSMGALPELTPLLFETFNGSAPGVGSTMNVTGVTSASNVVLTFSNTSPTVTLTIPNLVNATTTYAWNNYKVNWWIYSVSHSFPTATAGQVKVLIRAGATPQTAQEFVVTYVLNKNGTGIDVNGCQTAYNASNQNAPDCDKEEQFESALLALMQRVVLEGEFYTTTPYDITNLAEYNHTILEEIIGTNTADWTGPNVNGVFYINGTTSDNLAIDLTGTVPSGINMVTSVDLVGDVLYIQFLTSTGIQNMQATFTYQQNGNKPLALPLSCPCLTKEAAVTNYFNFILAQGVGAISSGSSFPAFVDLLPFLEYSNQTIDGIDYSAGVVSGNFFTIPDYGCEHAINWSGGLLSSISSVVFNTSGNPPYTSFTATGYIVGGGTTTVTGYIACLSSEEVVCDDCEPQASEPMSCTDAYITYFDGMSGLTTGFSPEELEVFEEEYLVSEADFCAYGYAYIAEAYVGYLSNLSITNLSNANYLSIAEFGATPLGYSSASLAPVVAAYVAATTLSNPTSASYIRWNDYVVEVYLVAEPDFCPANLPQMMVPNMTSELYPCDQWENNVSSVNAQNQQGIYLDQMGAAFVQAYIEGAMQSVVETFSESHLDKEFHYTLYYYDRAGNLIQTVPPKGVDRFEQGDATHLTNAQINALRTQSPNETANVNGSSIKQAPDHTFETNYSYNSLNQLVYQITPDGGASRFAYDRLGRLIMSQNAKQLTGDKFSYTKYDELGRVEEVGEMTLSGYNINSKGRLETGGVETNAVNASNFPDNLSVAREQITKTIYDELYDGTTPIMVDVLTAPLTYTPTNIATIFGADYNWDNTRNRIVGVIYQPSYTTNVNSYESAIFYDYDVHGNVSHMIQVNNDLNLRPLNQHIKHVEYTYDLVSGNVHKVVYQKDQQDQFMHRYNYDADNRITIAETSTDGVYWEKDAKYFYYEHGPLARTEIGEKKVQAQDYAYTVQGWLKTVNGEQISANTMMGQDGRSGTLNKMVGRDAYGYSLNYFEGDYASANTAMLDYSNGTNDQLGASLYNGNIRAMFTALSDLDENMGANPPILTHQSNYTYDQLNRIKSMNGLNRLTNQTTTPSGYSSTYSYDENGNLQNLKRYALDVSTSVFMDDFEYHYNTNTNQLNYVADGVNTSAYTFGDIQNTQAADNYRYDEIGQLIGDFDEGIDDIHWTVTNKVEDVIYSSGKIIHFDYDPMGNRIGKHVFENDVTISTYYTLDAQGNQMSVYTYKTNEEKLYLAERNIYGSSRIGQEQLRKEMVLNPAAQGTNYSASFYVGDKRFELQNHLGNVLEVIKDRKLGNNGGSGSVVAFFTPDVVSYSDYYPFGMMMPNRHEQENSYKYGFNGMEKDDEIKNNSGTSYDFGARMYDPRVGRWLSRDPSFNDYPSISPYVFAINSPNWFIDPNGKWVVEIQKNAQGQYQLIFYAQKDDNLTTLATQLGLPAGTILNAHPELEAIELCEGSWLTLENIEQVKNINGGINFIGDNQDKTNCTNLADHCDGGSNIRNVEEGENTFFFERELGNDPDFKLKEVQEFTGGSDTYETVSSENSRIGDIIMYKLEESSRPAIIQSEGRARGEDIMEHERHFSVIVLKSKDGNGPSHILQKNGTSEFDFKVDQADDNALPGAPGIKYKESTPAGASGPINRRVDKNE
jgi:RHS repeat-associated protein